MEEMTRVAEYLIRNETIDGPTFVKLYNGEPVESPIPLTAEDLQPREGSDAAQPQTEQTENSDADQNLPEHSNPYGNPPRND
jgi:cell division protease FtsH